MARYVKKPSGRCWDNTRGVWAKPARCTGKRTRRAQRSGTTWSQRRATATGYGRSQAKACGGLMREVKKLSIPTLQAHAKRILQGAYEFNTFCGKNVSAQISYRLEKAGIGKGKTLKAIRASRKRWRKKG